MFSQKKRELNPWLRKDKPQLNDGSRDSTTGITVVEEDAWKARGACVLGSDGVVWSCREERPIGEGGDGDGVADGIAKTAAVEFEWGFWKVGHFKSCVKIGYGV